MNLQEILARKKALEAAAASTTTPKVQKPQNETIGTESLLDRIRRLKAEKEVGSKVEGTNEPMLASSDNTVPISNAVPTTPTPHLGTTLDKYGNIIHYNERQSQFVTKATTGKSCVLIGAAGTGKTTCVQGALNSLIQSGRIPPLVWTTPHKHIPQGSPGIIICSFTRRAVNNIKRVLPEDLRENCITVHKLLEYTPVTDTYLDENGEEKTRRTFEPARNASNPLTESIHTIVIEEASMLGVDLFSKLLDALEPHHARRIQFLFLGDIQQLPPVFGHAILGYALTRLPTIELTEVYRQALESPIIKLAHRILSGTPIHLKEYEDWKVEGKLTIHPWKKKLHQELALLTLAKFFEKAIDSQLYDPEEDIILIPYNKACGTVELNKHIANYLSKREGRIVWEVIAGFSKLYYSVGDRVLYDKEDAIIEEIEGNPAYTGALPKKESVNLDYWGHNPKELEEANDYEGDIDDILGSTLSIKEDEQGERVRKASHKIVLRLLDTGTLVTVDTASEINSLIHSFAITVHKSQGSEWRKVFLLFHHSHATMLQRELLYTGVTRAREELYIICEPESLTKGILSQRIKGHSLEEKAEFFKGKLDDSITQSDVRSPESMLDVMLAMEHAE